MSGISELSASYCLHRNMERMDHEDRVFWGHFITKWRSNPSLWDTKSDAYKRSYQNIINIDWYQTG